VDVVGKKVENQVQFWSLLGPSLVLLSITVLLFKVSVHWYIPVSALIGIPLIVKWKMKGMAVALGFLLLLSGISYQNLDLDDRYWHVGLALTLAFSFIVLTLSLEEAQGLIHKLQLESQSRLDNFVLLDEKWKVAEQEWVSEREKSKAEISSLIQEATKTQEDKQTFYKLAQLAKDELVQVRNQHDQLLQDFLYKKKQIAELHERLEETELTIQGFVNSDVEKQIQSLTMSLANLEKEKETLLAKVILAQTEGLTWQKENEQLWQELQTSQDREKSCSLDQQRLQQESLVHENAFHDLQNKYFHLEKEKTSLLQLQQSGLQQHAEQMRDLEIQHRQLELDSQNAIHDLEAKLSAVQQQKDALQLLKKELEEQFIYQEKHVKQQDERYQEQLQHLYQQLQEEKMKVEEHLKLLQQNEQTVIKQKLERQQHRENLPYAPGNTRHIEAMYIQLKNQFQEKCDVLDETRRELFRANEKLLKWQKENEEERVYGESINEKYFQRHIIKLSQQYEQMQVHYRQEIDELVKLVEHLLYQLSRHSGKK
jgi:hypothetical protein